MQHSPRNSRASLLAQGVNGLQRGKPGSTPGSGRSPGEGNGYPLQDSGLEESHGQRSLVGYSPWGHKESDTTKQLTLTMQHYTPFCMTEATHSI